MGSAMVPAPVSSQVSHGASEGKRKNGWRLDSAVAFAGLRCIDCGEEPRSVCPSKASGLEQKIIAHSQRKPWIQRWHNKTHENICHHLARRWCTDSTDTAEDQLTLLELRKTAVLLSSSVLSSQPFLHRAKAMHSSQLWKLLATATHTVVGTPAARCARRRVFCRSIAMVIGPTPPGTGVIWDATFSALA